MDKLTSRAIAALEACSSSSDEDDVACGLMRPAQQNEHTRSSSVPINNSAIARDSSSSRNEQPDRLQFSNSNGGANLIFTAAKSGEKPPQFVQRLVASTQSNKASSAQAAASSQHGSKAAGAAVLNVERPNNSNQVTSSKNKVDVDSKRNTDNSSSNVRQSTNKSCTLNNHQAATTTASNTITVQELHRSISHSSLESQLQLTPEVITPHHLTSAQHCNLLQFYTSTPFDSRTMQNLHRSRVLNQPIEMILDDTLRIMSQKEYILKERDRRIDCMEDDLLEGVELSLED